MADVELSHGSTEMEQLALDLGQALRHREAVAVLTGGVIGTDIGSSGGDRRSRRRLDEEGDGWSTQK